MCVCVCMCMDICMYIYMKHKIVDFHMTYLHTHSVIYPSFKLHFLLYPPISFPTWPFLALFRFPLHILWRAIAIALHCQSGLHANKKLTVDPTTESKWLWSAQPQIEQLCYTTSPRPKDHHGEGGITIVRGLKRLEQKHAMSAAFINSGAVVIAWTRCAQDQSSQHSTWSGKRVTSLHH